MGSVLLMATIGVSPAVAQPAGPQTSLPKTQAVINEPEFQWESVPGATEYRLEVALDEDFTQIEYIRKTPATRYLDTSTWPAGSYWWRVRVSAPFRSSYSKVRTFTRTWIGPDGAGTGGREIARPDNVRIELDPVELGRTFVVTWDPVPGASYYQIQFDGKTEDEHVCETPHTAFTPYIAGVLSGEDRACLPARSEGGLGNGRHRVRVRAVDEVAPTGTGRLLSIWSDQARTVSSPLPREATFDLGDPKDGDVPYQPAQQTSPANGQVFTDMPVLKWRPVQGADGYRVVIARDQGFTNVVGKFLTRNTRLVPLQRLPEHNAIRSFYWLVVPCSDVEEDICLNEREAVNREGKFRSFRKKTVNVVPTGVVRRGTPWVELTWEALPTTMATYARRSGTLDASRGGTSWYELQWRPSGGKWQQGKKIATDLTGYLTTDIPFGLRFDWRVRPVDETRQARPWSETQTTKTARATAKRPTGLRASRKGNKVTLRWRKAYAKYFPVTEYTVYWSKNGKRWKPLAQVTRTKVRFKLSRKSKYWFSVSASNFAGESSPARIRVR